MTQKLLKKVDEVTAKHSDCKMGSFVVFLSDDDKLETSLKQLTEKSKFKKLVVSLDNAQGPPKYKINKDADVTVVLYTDRTVKANYSFAKDKLTDKDIEAIVKDVAKITPSKLVVAIQTPQQLCCGVFVTYQLLNLQNYTAANSAVLRFLRAFKTTPSCCRSHSFRCIPPP